MLVYGLITGILFGFFLQKAQVIRYDKQLGALRFIDMTIVKFMLSSILVGMVGAYLLKDLGWAELSVKETILGGNIIGGSSSVSVGDCWVTVPAPQRVPWAKAGGMRFGEFWGCWLVRQYMPRHTPALKKSVLTWGNFGKITLSQITGINHWIFIIIFVFGSLALFRWFEKKAL